MDKIFHFISQVFAIAAMAGLVGLFVIKVLSIVKDAFLELLVK